MVAQFGAERRGVADGSHTVRMNIRTQRRRLHHANAERLRVEADFLGKRTPRRWRPVRVAHHRAGRRVQQRGAVTHRDRQRVLGHQAAEQIAVVWTERHPRPRRLQAEYAAAGRRNADRATGVVAVRYRHHPRRHGGSRPATGAARRPSRIPGIVRRPKAFRFGDGPQRQLRRVRLAHREQPGPLEPPHQLAILGGYVVTQKRARLRKAHPGVLGEEVLEQKRHPGERPGRYLAHRRGPRLRIHRRDDGVQRRIQPLDPFDGRLDQLARLDGPLAHQRRLRGRVQVSNVVT